MIKRVQATLRELLLQNALISDGKSSPDRRNGKVWIPSCTAKTWQHAVPNVIHSIISRILLSSIKMKLTMMKKEEQVSLKSNRIFYIVS